METDPVLQAIKKKLAEKEDIILSPHAEKAIWGFAAIVKIGKGIDQPLP